jgi:cell division protease FtsH
MSFERSRLADRLQRDCSEATAREIDREVRALLETARDEARAILETRRSALELVSRVLMERETLDRASFEALLAGELRPGAANEAGASDSKTPTPVAAVAPALH